MFNSLEEQIDKTQGGAPSTGVRAARYAGLFVLSAIAFAALYIAIRLAG